jgi:hypothetical protein
MFSALISWVIFQRLITFGPEPLQNDVAVGRMLFQQGKGIERTLRQDRVVVGLWFNGRVKEDVESVTWLSPGMVSRWLGYLQAKEKWPDGEMQKRWDFACKELNGSLTFIVQVAAMPKLKGLDMEVTDVPEPTEIEKIRFLLTSGPGTPETARYTAVPGIKDHRLARYPEGATPIADHPLRLEPVKIDKLAQWRVRDRNIINGYRWYRDVPLGRVFLPEFDSGQPDPGFGFGDYQSAWYLIAFTLKDQFLHPSGFELRILSENKERIGHFKLLR